MQYAICIGLHRTQVLTMQMGSMQMTVLGPMHFFENYNWHFTAKFQTDHFGHGSMQKRLIFRIFYHKLKKWIFAIIKSYLVFFLFPSRFIYKVSTYIDKVLGLVFLYTPLVK